ncbi:unnamed protein product [Nesidiocoris tenuis]|uniref:Uncharacterized protein n=1 Tax=Nesidiocoris tenuis TaxID=355587 RepID=A0A6H5GKK3_9HEMI|nr:unnamed protein product [Nesidiocoris tenuis]
MDCTKLWSSTAHFSAEFVRSTLRFEQNDFSIESDRNATPTTGPPGNSSTSQRESKPFPSRSDVLFLRSFRRQSVEKRDGRDSVFIRITILKKYLDSSLRLNNSKDKPQTEAKESNRAGRLRSRAKFRPAHLVDQTGEHLNRFGSQFGIFYGSIKIPIHATSYINRGKIWRNKFLVDPRHWTKLGQLGSITSSNGAFERTALLKSGSDLQALGHSANAQKRSLIEGTRERLQHSQPDPMADPEIAGTKSLLADFEIPLQAYSFLTSHSNRARCEGLAQLTCDANRGNEKVVPEAKLEQQASSRTHQPKTKLNCGRP